MDKLLHLPIYDITLEGEYGKLPGCRQIKVYGGDSFKDISGNKKISGVKFLGKYLLFELEIDERNYNTIRAIGLLREIPIALTLIDKFNELKKSDISYGNYNSADIGSDSKGYSGSKPLYIEDFFNYLKIENRDLLISNILHETK